MKKMINTEKIEGRIYQHNLAVKRVQDASSENQGKNFIAGEIEIAVDEEGLNVIPVHYTYVTAVTKNGKPNSSYTVLEKIINENKTWMNVGKENATMVHCDTNLALNEFYDRNDNFVSVKRNEGGFIKFINNLTENEIERHKFTVDMLINRVIEVEPDEEAGKIGKVVVGGAVFDFKNSLLPVEFTVCEAGQNYFLGLDASAKNPIFTKVWGKIVCSSETVTRTEESAFGEAAVSTFEKKTKDWVITGTSPAIYEFGDENVLTVKDVEKAMQDREVTIAAIKKRNEEYLASKGTNVANAATPAAVAATIPNNGTFKF